MLWLGQRRRRLRPGRRLLPSKAFARPAADTWEQAAGRSDQKAPVTENRIRPLEMEPPSGTFEKFGCNR